MGNRDKDRETVDQQSEKKRKKESGKQQKTTRTKIDSETDNTHQEKRQILKGRQTETGTQKQADQQGEEKHRKVDRQKLAQKKGQMDRVTKGRGQTKRFRHTHSCG